MHFTEIDAGWSEVIVTAYREKVTMNIKVKL